MFISMGSSTMFVYWKKFHNVCLSEEVPQCLSLVTSSAMLIWWNKFSLETSSIIYFLLDEGPQLLPLEQVQQYLSSGVSFIAFAFVTSTTMLSVGTRSTVFICWIRFHSVIQWNTIHSVIIWSKFHTVIQEQVPHCYPLEQVLRCYVIVKVLSVGTSFILLSMGTNSTMLSV